MAQLPFGESSFLSKLRDILTACEEKAAALWQETPPAPCEWVSSAGDTILSFSYGLPGWWRLVISHLTIDTLRLTTKKAETLASINMGVNPPCPSLLRGGAKHHQLTSSPRSYFHASSNPAVFSKAPRAPANDQRTGFWTRRALLQKTPPVASFSLGNQPGNQPARQHSFQNNFAQIVCSLFASWLSLPAACMGQVSGHCFDEWYFVNRFGIRFSL